MKGMIVGGLTVGNGAAINIPCGFIPDHVSIWNVTDGDVVTHAFLRPIMPFSSGGTLAITAGMQIKGATSNATATIDAVILSSGTFAGGDAAGFFALREVTGTFQSEAAYVTSDETAGVDDATVAVQQTNNMSIDTEAATVTTTSAMSRLEGSAAVTAGGLGFIIGSVIAEEAKALRWEAIRYDSYIDVAA